MAISSNDCPEGKSLTSTPSVTDVAPIQSNESYLDTRSLSLLKLSPEQLVDIWSTCMKGMEDNLCLFDSVYGVRPKIASEFYKALSKTPPGYAKVSAFTLADRMNRKALGFTLVLFRTDDCPEDNIENTIFMPLRGIPGPFERSIEAIHLFWLYAIEHLESNRVDTRLVNDTAYGIPDHKSNFGIVGIVKRILSGEKTDAYEIISVTKDQFPLINQTGGVWLHGREISTSKYDIPGL